MLILCWGGGGGAELPRVPRLLQGLLLRLLAEAAAGFDHPPPAHPPPR